MLGIDVSVHQGDIDWPKVRKDGQRFVVCKCSEGADFRDPTWTSARTRAIRDADLILGAYHYLRPRHGRSGAVEAKWAVKTARSAGWGRPGDLRLVADIEETGLPPIETHRYLEQFVKEVVRLTGHKPIIYTYPSFWASDISGGRLGCPLWIAHYGAAAPSVPGAWKNYAIWQHSSTGRVRGIVGDVDLNRARWLPRLPEPRRPKAKAPKPKAKPKKKLTRRQRIKRRLRRARQTFKRTGRNAALRVLLFSKARLGIWDRRYCLYFAVDPDVTLAVKKFLTRAYRAGLVPTSTTGGVHSVNSLHYRGRAGDVGLRRELIGTKRGLRRMRRFQRREYRRRHKTKPYELIGPLNGAVVLQGNDSHLAEGTALEQGHDNHVHGGF